MTRCCHAAREAFVVLLQTVRDVADCCDGARIRERRPDSHHSTATRHAAAVQQALLHSTNADAHHAAVVEFWGVVWATAAS
eukprot:3840306-Rhodomonas_salina.1